MGAAAGMDSMLMPSVRTGMRIQWKVTAESAASTTTRAAVRAGFEPKAMRRARLTRASAVRVAEPAAASQGGQRRVE